MVYLFKLALLAGIATLVGAETTIANTEFTVKPSSGSSNVKFDGETVSITGKGIEDVYTLHNYDIDFITENNFTMGSTTYVAFAVPVGSQLNFYYGASQEGNFTALPAPDSVVISTVEKDGFPVGIMSCVSSTCGAHIEIKPVDGYIKGRVLMMYSSSGATPYYSGAIMTCTFYADGNNEPRQGKTFASNGTIHDKFGFLCNNDPENSDGVLSVESFTFMISHDGNTDGYLFAKQESNEYVDNSNGDLPKSSALSSTSFSPLFIASIAIMSALTLL